MSEIEVTKREILFSVIIIVIMVTLGFFINNKVTDSVAESNEAFYKSVKIDNNNDQFVYGMDTSMGDALVYGDFQSIDPVSLPELRGSYWYIEKVSERYTMHTRTVTTTDSKGNVSTRVETYYSWDKVGTETKMSDNVEFLGVSFDSNKFGGVYSQRLPLNKETVSEEFLSWEAWNYLYQDGDRWANVGDIRYKYNVVSSDFSGTIMAKLKDGTIVSNTPGIEKINIYYEQSIADIMKSKESSEVEASIMFWIVWVFVIAGAIYAFMYFDNRWLEG